VKDFLDRVGALTEVTFEQMLEYKEHLSSTYAEATAARKFTVIRSMYDFGLKTGYLNWNPASPLKAPKVTKRLADRILTTDQVKIVISSLKTKRWIALFKLLYITGMRCSEACNLKWDDVKDSENGATLTIEGKGDKVRYVKIPLSLVNEIKFQTESADYVFTTRNKNRITPSQVRKKFRQVSRKTGIKVSPHYMRHSHATHALANGANVVLVKDTLGHGNIAVTSQYLHANPNESSSDYLEI
jgi:integrase/recombinase XerD